MNKPQKATIVSIARKANVSRASVYAVLNATKNINIKVGEKTRKRIIKVSEEMGYVRNESARSLVTGKNNTIGIMLTDMDNQFFRPMLDEIYNISDERGYSVAVSLCFWNAERERLHLSKFCGNRVEGIIWAPTRPDGRDFDRCIKLIESVGIPVVLLGIFNRRKSGSLHQVGTSQEEAIRVGMEYLAKLGHRNIGILTARHAKGKKGEFHVERFEAMSSIAGMCGINVADEYTFDVEDCQYGGVGVASEIFRKPKSSWPTAIFAADDLLARGLIAGLSCLGVKIPDEISILGYDDAPGDENSTVPLTSISLKADELGKASLNLLLDIVGRKIPLEPARKILLPPQLVERKSCSVPRQK
ncbi:MAG: LacI family DNA-binding transcriptional regulator [Victivallales bacterium]